VRLGSLPFTRQQKQLSRAHPQGSQGSHTPMALTRTRNASSPRPTTCAIISPPSPGARHRFPLNVMTTVGRPQQQQLRQKRKLLISVRWVQVTQSSNYRTITYRACARSRTPQDHAASGGSPVATGIRTARRSSAPCVRRSARHRPRRPHLRGALCPRGVAATTH